MGSNRLLMCIRSAVIGLLLLLVNFSALPVVPAQTPGSPGIQDVHKWERINTGDEDFSIYMPVRPSFFVKQKYSHFGVLVSRALIGGIYYRGALFVVRVYEVPEPERLSDVKLTGDCPRLADLQVTEGRDVDRNGFKGKEYVKREDAYTQTVQCFVTKKRYYVIEAATRDKGNSNVEKFFSSLSLGGGEKRAEVTDDWGDDKNPPVRINGSKVFEEKEVTHPCVIIIKPPASYNPMARAAMAQGEVRLRAVFTATGEVVNVEVVKGLGVGLTESAIEATKSVKFIPAEKDGQLVSQYGEIVYRFIID